MALEYQGLSGQVLSPAEKAALSVSFTLLAQDGHGEVQFWGRVGGVEADYLLAQKGTADALVNQTFYSVDGGLNWQLLPAPTSDQLEYCRQLRGVFFGNPQYEYKIEEPVPEIPEEAKPEEVPASLEEEAEKEDGNDDEEEKDEDAAEEEKEEDAEAAEEEAKPPVKQKKTRIVAITEVIRLADFVQQVDSNCRVVPRGAYLLDETETVIPNKFFEGLSRHDAGKLASYFHTRRATKTTSDPFDFLEPIDQDMPKGVWTLKFDSILGIMVGANLLYPGFTFYHKPQTPVYGQYYFGDGQRNFDLCFML